MNKSNSIFFIIIIFSSIFSINKLSAQTNYSASDTSAIITITGTSTLHGWTVVANEIIDVPSNISVNIENGASIDRFSFGVAVKSMDGGRGASMNKKITLALKATAHPIITYQQNQPAIITDLDKNGNFKLISKGLLKMVGMEKEIEIELEGQKMQTGQLIIKGAKPFKFSDFDIEPPSALFGQIVCGEDISVNFEFRYK